MLVRECRIRKSSGVADKESFIKIFNLIVFLIFISIFTGMIDVQQHTQDTASMTEQLHDNIKKRMWFLPHKKFSYLGHQDVLQQ